MRESRVSTLRTLHALSRISNFTSALLGKIQPALTAGLALQVQEVLRRDPHGGHLFVFRGRRGDLVKLLWSDGDGLCLLAKRLERGRFVWPQADSGAVLLTMAQLSMLLEGIDWRGVRATWQPSVAA